MLDFVYIGQFDLLQCSRRQVTLKPWSRPAERETLLCYFKLQRAREEITRLDVEIKRMVTYIRDHRLTFNRILPEVEHANSALAYQLSKRYRHRRSLDLVHLQRFEKLKLKDGFTGSCVPGCRKLSNPAFQVDTVNPGGVIDNELDDHHLDLSSDDSDQEVDQETAALASEVLDFIAGRE